MNKLDRLETWIEQLVEEPFVRLFAGRLLPQEVATRLVRAMEDGEHPGTDGLSEVPGRYTIILHPEDLYALRSHHPHIENELAVALKRLAGRLGLRLREIPAFSLQGDPGLAPHSVRIAPIQANQQNTGTQDMEPSLESSKPLPQRYLAYLIIRGQRTFDLQQSLVRIGRALDNDLIIEDNRVSRYHAQLRYRYHRYILQDLGSRGGTSVNGFQIQEIVLRPGDLISLSGFELLYAENDSEKPSHPSGGTEPYPSSH